MSNTLKYNGKLNVLGERLRKYRLENDLSLAKLSNKLQLLGIDLPAQSIQRIETGGRTIKDYELAGLAKVLNFSIDDIFKNFIDKL